ncbi:sulfotransferase domain-containing protein [Candidatus Halocynthiibacter alkanivorans]|uniref:sulfotransferase domain-containing protein n=1 Tax=Candidatus Halocynthiibacter alkanivorans TaxID=2267619 RepID=UPI001359CBF5|nr:sulfotransferase domain-containing protein [Candidatus Halocynthiibacter alkanivorans]
MARVILHIGAHKTGTSFLQRCLFQNRALLEHHQIYYPDIGPNPAHHILAAPWIDLPEVPASWFAQGGADGIWDRLTRDYCHRPGTVFLSAEVFSRAELQRVDMAQLRDRLAPFEQVRILYTTRLQPALLQSVWLQRARSGKAPPFEQFLNHALESHLASGIWLDHGQLYSHLRLGFSPEQITFLSYEALCAAPGGVLAGFLAQMGCSLLPEQLSKVPDGGANISPNPLAAWIAWNIFGPVPLPAAGVSSISEAINSGAPAPVTLYSRAEYVQVARIFTPLNHALDRRLQQTQPGFSTGNIPDSSALKFREDLSLRHWGNIASAIYQRRHC